MAQRLNANQLARLWVKAGGDPSQASTAAAIALAESGGRTNALNKTAPDYSVGPWQINYYGNLRSGRTAQFGSPQKLMSDPLANARAAVAISQGGKDFSPWSTYKSGAYLNSGGAPSASAPATEVPSFTTPSATTPKAPTTPDLTDVVMKNLTGGYSPGMQTSNLVGALLQAPEPTPTAAPVPKTTVPTAPTRGGKTGAPVADLTSVGTAHPTAGLPGYPAHDYMAPAGSPTVAPVSGKVVKLSGHDPSNGPTEGVHGPFGWSVYILGKDGREYYLTHMGSRDVQVGQTVQAGEEIGTVGDYAKYGGANHIHMGVKGK